MSKFTLGQLQEEQKVWQQHNFPNRTNYHPFLGIFEELGELAHAQLKGEQNIRYSADEILKRKADAIGDVMIYMADYCTANNIILEEAMKEGDFWSYVPEFTSEFMILKFIGRYFGLCCEYHGFDSDRVRLYICQIVQGLRSYCKVNKLDFISVVALTWDQVKQRDWQKNPMTAAAVVEENNGL